MADAANPQQKMADQMAGLARLLAQSTDRNDAAWSIKLANWLKWKITDNKTNDSWSDLFWKCIMQYPQASFFEAAFCLEIIKVLQLLYIRVQLLVQKETGGLEL